MQTKRFHELIFSDDLRRPPLPVTLPLATDGMTRCTLTYGAVLVAIGNAAVSLLSSPFQRPAGQIRASDMVMGASFRRGADG